MIVGHAGEMPIDITKWLTLKGATIKGIYGRKVWDTWSDLAALVETKKIDLSGILTHTFGLSEVGEAFISRRMSLRRGAGSHPPYRWMLSTLPRQADVAGLISAGRLSEYIIGHYGDSARPT